MKKILCFMLCLASIFSLSACGESEQEHEVVTLTKDNYSNYININLYVSDFSAIISEKTEYSTYYDLSLVVHIETSKKVDCEFKDVSITYFPHSSILWQYSYKTSLPSTTLNLDGESHTSFIATKTDSPALDPISSFSTKGIIKSIEGYVILPKDPQ